MRIMLRKLFYAVIGLCFSCGASTLTHAAGTFDPTLQCRSVSAETCATAQALGRGMNMGNMLEAPREGDWGVTLQPAYIDIVAKVFKTVRIPIRWSNHAAATADATLDPVFAARVDQAVNQALNDGMYVIIDVHHYDQIFGDALQPKEFSVASDVVQTRLINIWRQIALRYKDKSPKLIFELLNEPHGTLDANTWNALLAQLIPVVRESNPTRTVLLGGTSFNSVRGLPSLILPPDRNLIVAIHGYEPNNFTHQGISWLPQYPAGTTCCDTGQQSQITNMLNTAVAWSKTSGYPIHLGEFGSFQAADMTSRAFYTRFVRDEAEKRGIGWTYWEFCSTFGAYDPVAKAWREPLRSALLD